MSSSKPKTAIFLSDSPEIAEKKVKSAKTGGRESLEEQRLMGGIPEDCVVYEMLLYHLVDSESKLKEMYHNCKSGTTMCGECKNQAAYMMRNFFEELSKKRISAEDDARKILNKTR